jgi:diacylglycerol kinase family enzyme
MRKRERILIFANPIAGRGRGRRMAERLRDRLADDGYEPVIFLERPDCFELASLDHPTRAAIAIGGDGTLRGIAHRLYLDACEISPGATTALRKTASEPPLLIVPLGTANLMGKHLGIHWKDRTLERQVSAAIAQNNVVRLDTARANGRLFLLMTGVGFDAHVVHELSRLRRGPIRLTNYLTPTLTALRDYRFPPLSVTVDGKQVFGPEPGIVFVGNLPEYGTGFPVLPLARADDGVLDVCALPARSVPDLMVLFLQAAVGEHLRKEGVVYVKGKRVNITAPGGEPVPVQVDGDPAGHTPVDIDLLPIRLPFIVPAEPGRSPRGLPNRT